MSAKYWLCIYCYRHFASEQACYNHDCKGGVMSEVASWKSYEEAAAAIKAKGE